MGRAEIRRFQRAVDDVASFIKPKLGGDISVKVLSHTDADGIASAAILAKCFCAHDVHFDLMFTSPLISSEVAELGKEDYDLFVFLDQGTGQIASIHKFILGRERDVLIVDHHPGELPKHPNLIYLNPHACGLDGAEDVSASGAIYSVVEEIDRGFRPLVALALVGMIGDRQEFFPGFKGINDLLVKRAVDLGFIQLDEGLKLVGRSSNSVIECLRLSTRPYIARISGDLEECRSLVDTLGLPHSSTLVELGSEAERKLLDAIFARVGPLATNEEFRHALWGTTYTIRAEGFVGPKDVREYITMLDACCDLRKPETGFAVAMGDENAGSDALALINNRQEQMLHALDRLASNLSSFTLTSGLRHIYFGAAVDSMMVGEVLSLLMESGLIEADRPVLGVADSGADELKASIRSTSKLRMKGVDVGQAIARAAEAVGGEGGGHGVAAAARVPRGAKDEFIARLDQILQEG